MTLELVMPDVVKLLVVFFRAQAEVVAEAAGASSIRGKLDEGIAYPAMRITRITSEPVHSRPHIVESVRVQLDCYGGNNRQAERLAQTARAALLERGLNYGNAEGRITRVLPVSMSDTPDDAFEPGRERYIVEMEVWVRPL